MLLANGNFETSVDYQKQPHWCGCLCSRSRCSLTGSKQFLSYFSHKILNISRRKEDSLCLTSELFDLRMALC